MSKMRRRTDVRSFNSRVSFCGLEHGGAVSSALHLERSCGEEIYGRVHNVSAHCAPFGEVHLRSKLRRRFVPLFGTRLAMR